MNLINNPVLVVDSPRPVSGQGMFQGFGFSNAFKWLSLYFLDKRINTFKYLLIGLLPVEVIFPCLFSKN